MHYLFLGDDTSAKDQKLAEIKKKIFPTDDAIQFDYDVLHGNKIPAAELKKSLISLPAVSQKRLVVIRQANKLSQHCKKLVLEFAQSKESKIDIVLDFDVADGKSSFINKISVGAKVFNFQKNIEQNVFDMTRCIAQGQVKGTFKILSELLSQGDHPLQIMGALSWFWTKSKNRMSPTKYRQGLFEIKEADLNIKRSRLKSEHALEVLVVKLMNL